MDGKMKKYKEIIIGLIVVLSMFSLVVFGTIHSRNNLEKTKKLNQKSKNEILSTFDNTLVVKVGNKYWEDKYISIQDNLVIYFEINSKKETPRIYDNLDILEKINFKSFHFEETDNRENYIIFNDKEQKKWRFSITRKDENNLKQSLQ